MSGHSKWHSIKHKKGAADAKRGKIFTKHARLITIAARSGGDPDMNPGLRAAIDNAKAENVPNDNIDRAIKKGSGEDKDAAILHEVMYEAYGPNGIAIIVTAITDNKNRTLTNVRTILSKNGGNMGESGSVAYMFNFKGYFVVDPGGKDAEELQLEMIEMGATDFKMDGNLIEVFCEPSDFAAVRSKLNEAGIKVESASLSYIPDNTVEITDEKVAEKILKLIDKIEEDDDVSDVYSNFDIPEDILSKLE